MPFDSSHWKDSPSAELSTMDGVIVPPTTSEGLRPSVSMSKPPSTVQVIDDANPSEAPSTNPPTISPMNAIVNNAEGTKVEKGSSASFLTLSQFVALTVVVVSIMVISFD